MSLLSRIERHHVIAGIVAALIIIGIAALPDLSGLSRSGGSVGIVKLNGPIGYDGDISQDSISPETVRSLTQQAETDDVDVIIYEINSGGGTVVASHEAANAIETVDIPTVCRMKEVAASGAYWMASACDVIVADPLTTTGSIGVRSAYLEYSGLMDKLGVEYVNLTSGEFKDMGSPFKNITDAERAKYDRILSTVHDQFVEDISRNRGMNVSDVRRVATGEVYLGETAQDLGLVDRLGNHDTAIQMAEGLANKTELREVVYRPPQRFDFASLLFSKIGEGIATGLRSAQEQGIQADIR